MKKPKNVRKMCIFFICQQASNDKKSTLIGLVLPWCNVM